MTFLAVGNAACDVIASVAAFATGVPKVGVGTTLGAGIFVTTGARACKGAGRGAAHMGPSTPLPHILPLSPPPFPLPPPLFAAVVAAVSFVADVRLARRSFVRDILFFIITIIYLLVCTLDGIITVGESFGFIIIYFVFLGVVVGGRCFRMLRTEDDHSSVAGVIAGEGKGSSSSAAGPSTASGSYQGPSSVSDGGGAGAMPDGFQERKKGILSALESARREAMNKQHEREIASLKNAKYFKADAEEEEEDADGDLGSGSGGQEFTSNTADEDKLLPSTRGAGGGAGRSRTMSGAAGAAGGNNASVTDDLPTKPSKWTAAFQATQDGGSGGGGAGDSSSSPQYLPFQMPKYHRKKLAKKLAKRLAARGIHHEVVTADGRTVDIAELALTDPDAAAQMIASAASAVTAEAMRHNGDLSFQEAAQAAAHGAVALGHSGGFGGSGADGASMGSYGGGGGPTAVPVEDLLAVLPQETVRPVARMYLRFKRVFGGVGPYYHAFMHTAEYPMIVARHLTIPLLHDGTYRRRLVLINLPFSLALFTVVMTTHVLKGTATEVGGFPLAALAALVGAAGMIPLHLWGLPTKAGRNEGQGLLAAAAAAGEDAGSKAASAGGGHGHGHGSHWYSPLVEAVAGPKGDPMPKGWAFTVLLLLSFVMSLIWLLLIANELVGTALCFGKILAVPDVVMGLAVLAVGCVDLWFSRGVVAAPRRVSPPSHLSPLSPTPFSRPRSNSINDLAASVTIAREGYPSMAVAGAYAGPMFNVLAGASRRRSSWARPTPCCPLTPSRPPLLLPLHRRRHRPAHVDLHRARPRRAVPDREGHRDRVDGLWDPPHLAHRHPHLGAARRVPNHTPHREVPPRLVLPLHPRGHHHGVDPLVGQRGGRRPGVARGGGEGGK